MKSGDQFHDTLHLTRVRREVSANERAAFVAAAAASLGELQQRYDSALAEARAQHRDMLESVANAHGHFNASLNRAQQALQDVREADVDDWYGYREVHEAAVEQAHQSVRALEILCRG